MKNLILSLQIHHITKLNSGKLPDNIKLISKFEKHMNLEDLIHKISKILNKNGIFYMGSY